MIALFLLVPAKYVLKILQIISKNVLQKYS